MIVKKMQPKQGIRIDADINEKIRENVLVKDKECKIGNIHIWDRQPKSQRERERER